MRRRSPWLPVLGLLALLLACEIPKAVDFEATAEGIRKLMETQGITAPITCREIPETRDGFCVLDMTPEEAQRLTQTLALQPPLRSITVDGGCKDQPPFAPGTPRSVGAMTGLAPQLLPLTGVAFEYLYLYYRRDLGRGCIQVRAG